MSKPYIAIRISAPNDKNGNLRSGWIVREAEGSVAAFVFQFDRGPDDLYRQFRQESVAIVGGFAVTVREYREQLRYLGMKV